MLVEILCKTELLSAPLTGAVPGERMQITGGNLITSVLLVFCSASLLVMLQVLEVEIVVVLVGPGWY